MAVGGSGITQQDPSPIDSLLHLEPAVADQRWIDRHAGCVHRGPEAVDPGPSAEDVLRPADDRDTRVPETEQVASGRQAAVPVRGPDRRRVVGQLAGGVDDHERDAASPELVAHRFAEVGEDGDHAGRPAGEDALDPAASRSPSALHLREHHREMIAAGDVLDAPDDLEPPLAFELVEDQLEDRSRRLARDRPDGSRARGSPPRRVCACRARRPTGR